VLCHAGYQLREVDFHDMQALHRRFGVRLPSRAPATLRQQPVAARAGLLRWSDEAFCGVEERLGEVGGAEAADVEPC
jgi:hypothetical protein